MKSKLVILSLLMAGAATTVTAQTKEKFYSEKAGDNIFISVGVGAQANMSSDNRDNGLGDAITPKVTLSLGKWFSPVWGVRGQVAGWDTKLYTTYNHGTIANNMQVFGPDYKEVSKNYISTHLDALLNLSHLIAGYNPDRLFNLSAFAGPGLTFVKNGTSKESYTNADETQWIRTEEDAKLKALINASVGLLGQFNLNNYLDLNIEVRGEVSPSPFGKMTRARTDGALSATAGLTYTFGGKKFISCGSKIDVDALNAEINKYRQALADAEAERDAARRALANVKPEVKEVVKEVEVAGPRAIFFQIGKSNIDDYGMVNIQLAAKIIKANPDKKYKVAGYADKATGSAGWNQKLSEKRAQAVHDALIKEGVSSDQLELVGYGGTANMFGKNLLNRVVILE